MSYSVLASGTGGNMRFTVFVLLFTMSCCCAQRMQGSQNWYNKYFYRAPVRRNPIRPVRPVNPGTTPDVLSISEEDERLTDEIGVKIPSDECVISWDVFKEDVVDKDWICIYGIDDDAELNPGVAYKFSARWTVINDTVIRRAGSIWETDANRCLFISGLFRRVRISESLAVFGSISGNLFATDNRRDYFVCSKERPVKYCLFYICYDTQRTVDGRCRNSESLLMVREQRDEPPNSVGIREQPIRLNDIPWSEIEDTLINCVGQSFDDNRDPQMVWTWKNPSCAVPGTATFDAELTGMNG